MMEARVWLLLASIIALAIVLCFSIGAGCDSFTWAPDHVCNHD